MNTKRLFILLTKYIKKGNCVCNRKNCNSSDFSFIIFVFNLGLNGKKYCLFLQKTRVLAGCNATKTRTLKKF